MVDFSYEEVPIVILADKVLGVVPAEEVLVVVLADEVFIEVLTEEVLVLLPLLDVRVCRHWVGLGGGQASLLWLHFKRA